MSRITSRGIPLEKVLFDDETGTDEAVTLNDDVSNYKYIEIFFRSNDNAYNSVKVYNPYGKLVSLFVPWMNTNTLRYYIKSKIVKISQTTIANYTSVTYSETTLTTTPNIAITATNYVYITRVVGYN